MSVTNRPLPGYTGIDQRKGGAPVRSGCQLLGLFALAIGVGILVAAIFPAGFLLFLIAFLLIGCGWACMRRR